MKSNEKPDLFQIKMESHKGKQPTKRVDRAFESLGTCQSNFVADCVIKYRSKSTAVKKFVNMAMSCFLLHIFKYRGGYGDSRGMTGLFRLGDCNGSITTHLNNCHLSRESVTEFELILTRAGVSELPLPKVSEMMICPKHRYSLGIY